MYSPFKSPQDFKCLTERWNINTGSGWQLGHESLTKQGHFKRISAFIFGNFLILSDFQTFLTLRIWMYMERFRSLMCSCFFFGTQPLENWYWFRCCLASNLARIENWASKRVQELGSILRNIRVSIFVLLAPVFRRLDIANHQINRYPAVKCWLNKPRYPLDSDLSGG